MLQGRNWRVVDLLELGRVREAAAEIDAYEALADAVALPHFRWYVPLWRATLALLAGRWAEARELAERALALGRQADDPNAPLFVGIQRHHGLYAQRRIDEIDRARLVEGAAASPAATEWLVNLALLDAETGATEDARRLVAELGARRLQRPGDGRQLARRLRPGRRRRARGRPRGGRGALRAARAARAAVPGHRPCGRMPRLGRVLRRAPRRASSGATTRPWPGCAARWPRTTAPAPGPTPPSPSCASARRSPHGGEQETARDALQQAAKRADALDMPALAADAGRLLGATVA